LQQSPRKITVRATSQAPPSFGKDALGTGADLKLINKTSDTATYRLSFDLPSDVSGYQGLTLSDTLPDELAYQSDSGLAGAAATVNGQDLSWTLTQAQIAAAAGSTVSVDVTVKLSAAATSQDNGAVTNTAALHVDYDPSMPDPPADPDPATNTELEIGLPDAPSGFTKVKSDGDGILNSLEETAEYTISMNVPADVSEYASIVATDAVPSTLQIVGSPTTASGTASASGNTVTWTLDTPAQLADAAGKTITLTIPVRAAANATAADNGVITNTANTTVTFSDASTEDLPPATNTEVELRLTPAPTGLTKALSSGEAGKPAWDAGVLNHADDAVQFQVSAKLPADVRNYASFTLIDTLPAGLAVEGTPSVDADGADVTGLGTFTAASTRWTVDLTDASNAAALAGKTLTMTLAVAGDGIDDTDNGTLTNTGSWAVTPIQDAQDPADPDPDPENVVVSYPEPIDPDSVFKDAQGSGADLKLINKSPTSPDTATYRLGFTLPQDVSDYAGVTLTDALPAELEYVSDTGLAGVNATVAGQTLTWALDQATVQANAGQALTVDVVVKVASGAISADNGALTNTATVSVQWDPNLPGDQQPEDPEPKPNTEVELGLPDPPGAFTKIVSEGDGVLGSLDETATYRISMNIPQDVSEYQEVRITDQVPALLQIVGDPATDSGTSRSRAPRPANWASAGAPRCAEASGAPTRSTRSCSACWAWTRSASATASRGSSPRCAAGGRGCSSSSRGSPRGPASSSRRSSRSTPAPRSSPSARSRRASARRSRPRSATTATACRPGTGTSSSIRSGTRTRSPAPGCATPA
jgi:fimbrial isopeptide formation D2 family protein